MRFLRLPLYVVGVVCVLMGVLWIGQGTGYIRWPASSFMIDLSVWATRGALLAAGGLALILVGRRLRQH